MDIRQLSEQQILERLSRGENIPYYPDISRPSRETAMQTFQDVLNEENKLQRALSRGISEQKGFKGSTKIPDIVKELSSDMGIQTPKLEFKYHPTIMGSANVDENILRLNPVGLSGIGREGVIAHELRHLKEGNRQVIKDNPLTWDSSIRNILYTETPETGIPLLDLQLGLHKAMSAKEADLKEQGKSLNYFQKVRDRLFPNDKLKYQVDALDAYDFLEKGHFDKSFLKENLKRVSKGLPVIGTAATVLGGLGYSDMAGAATDMVIPGGLEETGIADERSIPDPKYQEYIRRMSQRKK